MPDAVTGPSPPSRVAFVEVAPRDGLQNEAVVLPTEQKLALITRARAAGAARIEVASFVNPRRVPQMADAEAVVAGLPDDGAVYIGLVLNARGARRALATKVGELGAVCAASDAFAQANQGQTAAGSLAVASEIVALAREDGRRAQITIATSFGCPFEGEVDPARVIDIAKAAADARPVEVALADTIGVATPGRVADLVARVAAAIAPIPVRIHLHDTRNTGIANIWAAMGAGASVVDGSIGGIGGCPFAPGAAGNVASEDIAYLLEREGIDTGLDLDALIEASRWLGRQMGRALPSTLARAGRFPGALARTAELRSDGGLMTS